MEGMIICNPRIQFQRPLNVAQCPIQILAVLEEKIRVPIMDEGDRPDLSGEPVEKLGLPRRFF